MNSFCSIVGTAVAFSTSLPTKPLLKPAGSTAKNAIFTAANNTVSASGSQQTADILKT